MSGVCGCGCGEPTARRYRPGHDARHKASLKEATMDRRWWVRERAVETMVEMGWGRHVDPVILATTPIRSRYRGRFTETRHVATLHGVCLDAEGTGHSVWFCPAAINPTGSNGRWVRGLAGWLCSVCIHTWDHSETVNAPGYGVTANAVDLPRYVARHKQGKRPRSKARIYSHPDWAALDAHAQADHGRHDPPVRHTTRPRPGRSRKLTIPR